MTALIWDLDGTLLDSYPIIVDCALQTLRECGETPERGELHRRLIESSVKDVLTKTALARGLDPDALWEHYQALNTAEDGRVRLMEGAAETLEALSRRGTANFVFTHKGATARAVLEKLGVWRYFADILSAGEGIPRKPAPDGINLLCARHSLDKRKTFYVGDRALDLKCAHSAGVGAIFFLPPSSPASPPDGNYITVRALSEIPEIIRNIIS